MFQDNEERFGPREKPLEARHQLLIKRIKKIEQFYLKSHYWAKALPHVNPIRICKALDFIGWFIGEEKTKICKGNSLGAYNRYFSSQDVGLHFLSSTSEILQNSLLDECPGRLYYEQPPLKEICDFLEDKWAQRFDIEEGEGKDEIRATLKTGGIKKSDINEIVDPDEPPQSWFWSLFKYALENNLRNILVRILNSFITKLSLDNDELKFFIRKRIRKAFMNEQTDFDELSGSFILLK